MWLATTQDQHGQDYISRFEAAYWTLNFPRPMMGAVISTGADQLRVPLVFYRKEDLAGLIWASEDSIDHPLMAYGTRRDYRGVTLSFRFQSTGIKQLPDLHGPTLTLEGRDENGAPRVWYVRLWNYATGAAEDAVISLDFDNLAGGFLHPQEADPVYAGDIDRMFISMVPPEFDGTSTGPISDGQGGYAPVEGEVILSDIRAGGGGIRLPRGGRWLRPQGFEIANGYDDVVHISPERMVENILFLGYRGRVNHYLGMSHYYRLAWDETQGRFVVDPVGQGVEGRVMNAPARAWHEDYFQQLEAVGMEVILSLSFEILAENIPEDWAQRAHDGAMALTGWSPPSSLIAPTHMPALDYLKAVLQENIAVLQGAGLVPQLQIGEPWWWVQLEGSQAPCFYDAVTTALWTQETGLAVPAMLTSVTDVPDSAQQAYHQWLGDKLGQAVLALRDDIRASDPTAAVGVLFYTPQVLRDDATWLEEVNFPASQWAAPAFDFFQLEDYDHVIAGDWARHRAALDKVQGLLGYGADRLHYFAGFNLLASTPELWQPIDRAAQEAWQRGEYDGVFIWALPQVLRDGAVIYDEGAEAMTSFHEVTFPQDISYGASGGPQFSTLIVQTASGHESRNQNWAQARALYDVGLGLRSEADLAEVIAFFRARGGAAIGFRFKDWSDYQSSAPGAAITPDDQILGAGDGTRTGFRLIKTYDSGEGGQVRPISHPVTESLRVALDGAEQISGWQWNAQTGEVQFDVAPAMGVVVSVGYAFEVPVRFGEDYLAVSLETFRAGQIPSIPLVEIRWSS